MSETKGQHEPSMEEILASIRRIIAEDGDQPAAPGAQARPVEPSSDEVLELTEVVNEDGSVRSMEPATASTDNDMRQTATAPPREPTPVKGGDRLVSDEAAAQSIAALSQLNQLGARSEPRMTNDIPLGDGQRTIEEMVRELLRPILKEWLDTNLPQIVERLVKVEIARMVRDAEGR